MEKGTKLVDQLVKAKDWPNWSVWLVGFIFTLVVTFIGGSVIQNDRRSLQRHEKIVDRIASVDKRLAMVEANRFTATDGRRVLQDIMKQLPPKWLVDRVEKNDKRIEKILDILYKRSLQ